MKALGQSTWTDSAGSRHVNDICLGEGGTDFALATGEAAYESIITDVIRTLKGEIQLDLDLGMDYEETVWANLKKIGEWKRQVTNRVLELDFVQSIISFEAFAQDGTLRYELNVQTDLGTDTISGGVSLLSRTKVLTSDNIVLSSSTFSYSGAEQRPTLSVVFDGKVLTEEVDYTVSFPSESRTVGVKQIFVCGRGKYSGTAATAYEIAPYDLSLGATCPTFVIYHDTSEAVPEGGRFSDIVYDNYGNVVTYKPRRYWYDVKTLGSHEMVLDGTGNYTGSCSFTYYTRVNIGDEFAFSGAYISLNQKVFTYDQAFHKPTSATIAIPGQDVSLDRVAITVEATAQKASGRYTAIVTAVGDFVYGTREVSFYVTDYLAFEFKEPWKLDDVDEKGYGLTFVNGRAYWDWLEVSNDLTTWEDWTEDYEGGTTGDLYYNPLSNPYGLDRWFPSVVFIRGRQKNVRSEDSEVYFTTCSSDRDNQLKCNVYGSMSSMNKDKTALTPNCYMGLFEKFNTETAPALPATTLSEGCYDSMFKKCTSLLTPPSLPATTLANWCYYQMFSGCTSLETAPALPATNLAETCYGMMFSGCTSLETAPALPATTLADWCYWGMFSVCESLVASPKLPATTLVEGCYAEMFRMCRKLRMIEVCFTSWINVGEWVLNVSSSGTFKAPADLPDERGVYRIPAGWTLVRTS